ncbi:MAG: tetratricopeptide repeat protein [Candidatus Brocadiaceae bacterium]|jgi:Flp pilus assembly protein TadD
MRAHATAVVAVLVFSAAVFLNALRAQFLWDDAPIIQTNPGIRSLQRPTRFFAPEYWRRARASRGGFPSRGYRPVTEVSFALDYAVWRLRPVGYHLTNVLLHMGNCVLVYVLAYWILRSPGWALLCALLFAAHPVHVEPIAWAKARAELLALLFMLLSSLAHLRFVASPSAIRLACLYVPGVACFALAMLSKPSATVLPALLAAYAWCLLPRPSVRRALFALLPLCGVVALFTAVDAAMPPAPRAPVPLYAQLASGLAIMGISLRLLLVPAGLCFHHDFGIVHSLASPVVLKALPFVAALALAALAALRRSKTAFFALAWIGIAMAPLSLVSVVGRPVAESRLYVPSLGLCLLIALLGRNMTTAARASARHAPLARLPLAICLLVLGVYAGLAIARTGDWTDVAALMEDTLAKNRHSAHSHRALARIYRRQGDLDSAIRHFREAVELYAQEDPRLLAELAAACERAERHEEALRWFRAVVRLDPQNAYMRVRLGAAFGRKGLRREAEGQLRTALELAPPPRIRAEAHYNLGVVYSEEGRFGEAVAELERAVELDPGEPGIRYALATAYARAGRREEAAAAYRKTYELEGGEE